MVALLGHSAHSVVALQARLRDREVVAALERPRGIAFARLHLCCQGDLNAEIDV